MARFGVCSTRGALFAGLWALLVYLPADEAVVGGAEAALGISTEQLRGSLRIPRREYGGESVILVSGAAAFKSLVAPVMEAFERTTHVMPVSDDGGSSAEIRRVYGGPAIGDIRARLVKAARAGVLRGKEKGVCDLMSLRLDPTDEVGARREWEELLTGKHFVLATLEDGGVRVRCLEVLNLFDRLGRERAEEKGIKPLALANGSVGNFLLTGLSLLLGGLQPAIEWASLHTGVSPGVEILPSADPSGGEGGEEGPHIWAELEGGAVLEGQNEISHPLRYPKGLDITLTRGGLHRIQSVEKELCGNAESATEAPITRIAYKNTPPPANADFLRRLGTARAVLYGPGSLFTSILPCLILPGVGEAVCGAPEGAVRALLLNSCPDRETAGLSAAQHVEALAEGLRRYGAASLPTERLVNTVVVPEGSAVRVDEDALERMGVRVVYCPCACERAPTGGEEPDVAGAEGHVGSWKELHIGQHKVGEFCADAVGRVLSELVCVGGS